MSQNLSAPDGASLRDIGESGDPAGILARVRTTCLRISLARQAARGTIMARPDYIAVSTPESPTFWFGNFLLLRDLPEPGSLATWESRFDSEIGSRSGHRLFVVDFPEGDPGALDDFQEAGYSVDRARSMVFHASEDGSINLPPQIPGLDIEELDSAGMEELALAEMTAFRANPSAFPDADETYLRDQGRFHARLVDMGVAVATVCRMSGRIVSSAIFVVSGGEALIEDVRTDPLFRHRGLCRTLLARSMEMLHRRGVGLFVLEPVDAYARSIYSGLGFVDGDRLCSILKRPALRGVLP